MIKEFIRHLLTITDITDKVDTRITPVSAVQGEITPYIVVSTISGASEYADDGDAGINSYRLQIDLYGDKYKDVDELSISVKNALTGVANLTVLGLTFLNIIEDNERDMREPGTNTSEYFFRKSLDYLIWTQE